MDNVTKKWILSNGMTLALSLVLCSCSAISIRNVEPEKLNIDVSYHQSAQKSDLNIVLTRGIWRQPVSLDGVIAEVTLVNGERIQVIPSRQKGRYGIRERQLPAIESLVIGQYPEVYFPAMPSVALSGLRSFEGQSFFKDDVLVLDLRNSSADERFLVTTGYCSGVPYRVEQKISLNDSSLEIALGSVMNRINSAAEADLNGVIPITLSIEERYSEKWPVPFDKPLFVSSNSAEFAIDTSGFRFKASVSIGLANNVRLNFQNQPWPVRYCY
jgi:hypothetical protein